jgi:hypothetical protein
MLLPLALYNSQQQGKFPLPNILKCSISFAAGSTGACNELLLSLH